MLVKSNVLVVNPQVGFFHRVVWSLVVLVCFSACHTPLVAFKTPGEINDIRATVYLHDAEEPVSGYLSLNTAISSQAQLRLPQLRETRTMPLDEIKGYALEDVFYARKYLQPDDHPFRWMRTAGGKYAFVKRLTPEHYSINLYQYDELVQEAKSPLTKTVQHYYVSLPGDMHAVWPLQSKALNRYWKDLSAKLAVVSGNDPAVNNAFKKLQQPGSRENAVLKIASLYEVYRLHEN